MAATLACLAPWSAAARSTQAVVPGPGTGIEGPGIPDPAEATRIALEATPDGRDLRDEAWHRLVAEAAAWPRDPEAFASATVVRPRWRDAIDDPDRFRGELLEATGRLEQMDPVRTPGVPDGAVVEWFIRTDPARGGEVVQAFLPATAAVSGRVGSTVTVVGRLLRRTELEASMRRGRRGRPGGWWRWRPWRCCRSRCWCVGPRSGGRRADPRSIRTTTAANSRARIFRRIPRRRWACLPRSTRRTEMCR